MGEKEFGYEGGKILFVGLGMRNSKWFARQGKVHGTEGQG